MSSRKVYSCKPKSPSGFSVCVEGVDELPQLSTFFSSVFVPSLQAAIEPNTSADAAKPVFRIKSLRDEDI